jgi:aspartyl-tRNA(Asn)/glutamyl-tRNA(Gln) amidotransferase subunit A
LPDSFELGVQAAEVVLPVEIAAVHHDWYEARPDDYGEKLRDTIETGRRITAPSYVRAQRIRRAAVVDAKAIFDEVDLLVTPTTPTAPPRGFETTGDPRFNIPFSSLGLPSLTVPIPVRKGRFPVGLQLVGDHGRDRSVIAAGRLIEDHFDVQPLAAVPAGMGR